MATPSGNENETENRKSSLEILWGEIKTPKSYSSSPGLKGRKTTIGLSKSQSLSERDFSSTRNRNCLTEKQPNRNTYRKNASLGDADGGGLHRVKSFSANSAKSTIKCKESESAKENHGDLNKFRLKSQPSTPQSAEGVRTAKKRSTGSSNLLKEMVGKLETEFPREGVTVNESDVTKSACTSTPAKPNTETKVKASTGYKKKSKKISTGSDSSLLGAQRLLEDVLHSNLEKRERRLTSQLEQLENEISNRNKRRESMNYRESDISIASFGTGIGRFSLSSLDGTQDILFPPNLDGKTIDLDETINSEYDDDLETKHAILKEEHTQLQGMIKGMTAQLKWIKRQLSATRGHARSLSRSTSDWADLYSKTTKNQNMTEKKRLVRQGAVVTKHSENKRGCGPRFLAVNADDQSLLWSKSISGALSISNLTFQSPAQKEGDTDSVSVVHLRTIKKMFYGEELVGIPPCIFHTRLDLNDVTFNLRTIGIQFFTDDKITLFEFADADLAHDFYTGLKHMTSMIRKANSFTSPVVSSGQQTPPYLCIGSVGFKTPDLEKSIPESFTPDTEPEDEGDETTEKTRLIDQLQKALSEVKTKSEYLQIIEKHTQSCPLMLPLKSSYTRRHMSTDFRQVKKDLAREKSIIINTRSYELGSMENVDKVIASLKRLLTMYVSDNNGTEKRKEECESICLELLLAASRTVIEGDVFTLCHKLLAIPGRVMLCPAQTSQTDDCMSSPVEIFFATDGLITIESETSYRIVGTAHDEILAGWGLITTKCVEHIHFGQNQENERNIRHVKISICDSES